MPKKKKVADHGPSIKDPEMFEALLDDGLKEGKAAAISNAAARDGRSEVGRRGGKSASYEDQTKDELMKRARDLNVTGRSSMSKAELIEALRKG